MKLRYILYIFFISLFFAQILITDVFATVVSPVKISPTDTIIDLSSAVEIFLERGENFRISTTPGPDSIIRRIEVQANSQHPTGHWAVFTIANSSDEKIDRFIVAPHYRLVNSGLFSPDLGSIRINSITPSEGFSLTRQSSIDSDIFLLTINPGSVITFVAELSSSRLPQLYLWDLDTYKNKVNSYTLYHGMLLGIAGLLSLLLTVLFIVKGTSLFPITAIFAWSVLLYLCVDFSFLNKIFTITSNYVSFWRAIAEGSLFFSLSIFLFSYFNLKRWHGYFTSSGTLRFLALSSFYTFYAFLSFFDPTHAAGIARIFLGLTTILGLVLISWFSFRGNDRAIMLIPTWIFVIFWFCGNVAAIVGFIDNDLIQAVLASGLVLIVLLISFTVMQYTLFDSNISHGLFSDTERKALAVMGTDHVVWDWDLIRDRIYTNPDLSIYLGSAAKSLSGSLNNWFPSMHTEDRSCFRLAMDAILENRGNKITKSFRLRAGDGQYLWFSLHARPVRSQEGKIIRCIGIMIDITQKKKMEERLYYNSIYDSLTGLPNKQLFLDRLQTYCNLIANNSNNIRPALLVIDFDDFRSINQRYGMSVGDAFLLTVARRLSRHLIKPLDTLCRLSADRFAFLLISQSNLGQIATFALSLQKTLALPVTFSKQEIKVSTSIGVLPWTGENIRAEDRLNDATLAMCHAKYQGGNRVEPFQPSFRSFIREESLIGNELHQALTNKEKELEVVYSPVFDISNGTIIGLEARLRWNRPAARAPLFLPDFVHTIENLNLGIPIINYVISHASNDTTFINEHFPKNKKEFFVSIGIPSPYFIRHELLNSFQSVLVRTPLKEGQLHIETSQSVLMQNPELTFLLFQRLKGFGIGLILNNFGAEYSSFECFSRFPLTMIKLDRSIFHSKIPNQRLVLRALITMAHDLNFKVIAGDVESREVVSFLKEAHCDYLQSETFCNPMPLSRIISLLKKHQIK